MNSKTLLFAVCAAVAGSVASTMCDPYNFDADVRCMFMSRAQVCCAEARQGTLTREMVEALDMTERQELEREICAALEAIKPTLLTPSQARWTNVGVWAAGMSAIASYLTLLGTSLVGGSYINIWLQDGTRASILKELKEEKGSNALFTENFIKQFEYTSAKARWDALKYIGVTVASITTFAATTAGWGYCQQVMTQHGEAASCTKNLQNALTLIATVAPAQDVVLTLE